MWHVNQRISEYGIYKYSNKTYAWLDAYFNACSVKMVWAAIH